MATRFYFHASGTIAAPTNPAFDAGWEQTGQATRLPMDEKVKLRATTALTNSSAITVPITTVQQILCYQFTSNQVYLPVRLDASVLFSMVIRGLESNAAANAFLAYVLRAVTPDGGTFLGTLASSMTNAGTEFAITDETRIFGSATTIALTNTVLNQPFRLVLEVGAHAQAPASARTYTYRVGCSAATDFALTSALTTDLNPWMEVSTNLNATQFNNYHALRVGDGMSCGDRIR